MFKRLTVIGVGLIGGSLARALRARGLVTEVLGCGRDLGNLQRGVELGVIDGYTTDPVAAVAEADLVVVATTLGATGEILQRIAPSLRPEALITDVGSTKQSVVVAARSALGANFPRFVPGHPIAGGEKSGVAAALPDLFVNHRVSLTPLPETAVSALAKIHAMWEAVGAVVSTMDVALHDEVLAATSHLPHMLAYALVDCLAAMSDSGAIFEYAGGGFRDFTRIASSSPDMWRDIALANREALSAVCTRFQATFSELQQAIATSDGAALHGLFTRAKLVRDEYLVRRNPR